MQEHTPLPIKDDMIGGILEQVPVPVVLFREDQGAPAAVVDADHQSALSVSKLLLYGIDCPECFCFVLHPLLHGVHAQDLGGDL